MPARGSLFFLKYTTTGHGSDGVGSICSKDIYLVHEHWAQRRRGGFHLFGGYLLGTRTLGAEATGWVSFVMDILICLRKRRS